MAYTFRILSVLGVVLSVLAASPALAQLNAGDPCPEPTPGRIFTQEGAAGPSLVCNGTTLEVDESIKTGPYRRGVGTANPAAMLDVAGEAKIGNTSLVCSATTEGAMRYNSTSKEMEYCNGTDWTSLSPAAGGGKPSAYSGTTPTSYNGAMGGIAGANAKCNTAFPGSRIMRFSEVVWFASNMTIDGWILGDSNDWEDSYNNKFYIGGGCLGFTVSNSVYPGLAGSGTSMTYASCNSSYPIHCVKD